MNTDSNDTASPASLARRNRTGPFSDGAHWYIQHGWHRPIPVRGKTCVLRGVTGYAGNNPSPAELASWVRKYGNLNIAIVLPSFVIGLDIDCYDERRGAETLQKLQRDIGGLPATWRSTARAPEDPVSGVYLYRVPAGQRWVADCGLGSGIEVVQHSHRYVVCAPSIHPATKRIYWWWRGGSRTRMPNVRSIPALPAAWQRYLLDPRPVPTHEYAHKAAAQAWLNQHGEGRECPQMEVSTKAACANLRDAGELGGLHDEMTRQTWFIIHLAAEGHRGLASALEGIKSVFYRAGHNRKRGLNTEWVRAVENAIAHAAAQPQSEIDPCYELSGGVHARQH